MHVSLRHARRMVLGVAMGALFLAAAPRASRADIVSICIAPHGQNIVNINGTCDAPNRQITWDTTGVEGPTGPQGPKGAQGPAGPMGATGPNGPQGPVGPAGPIGPVGLAGATGPIGPAGLHGQEGPQGPTGPTGATGPTGSTGAHGVNAVNGVQFYTLGGGDLGSNAELLFGYASILSGNPAVGAFDVYYGPGNGADTMLESVAVPIDVSTATQLWVQTKNAPGPGSLPVGQGASYTFRLCVNSDCDTSPVKCTINLPNLTECNDLVHTQHYNAGDTIALEGEASEGAAPTEVSWVVVMHQTGGDIPIVIK